MERLDLGKETNKLLDKTTSSKSEFEKYKTEVFNKILNDTEVYEILLKKGFNNELIFKNLAKCNDFLENFHKVKDIKTYNDCVKNQIFYRYDLEIDGEFVELKRIDLEPVRNRRAFISSFPNFCDLDEDLIQVSTFKKAIDKSPLSNQSKKMMFSLQNSFTYIYGGRRTGKTYLVASYLNSYLERYEYNKKVAYIDCSIRFDEFAQLMFSKFKSDKDELNDIVTNLIDADVLVFDNFGTEYKCYQLRQSFLLPILRSRSKDHKPTIFISIYKPEEIIKLYTLKKGDEILVKELSQILCSNITQVFTTSIEPNLF